MQEVKIKIIAKYQEESSEAILYGNSWVENGDTVIEYDEDESLGMGNVKTTINYNQSKMSLKRDGDITMEMIYCKGGSNIYSMDTEFGTLEMKITTTSYVFETNNGMDIISIKYLLEVEGSEGVEHDLIMEVSTVQS